MDKTTTLGGQKLRYVQLMDVIFVPGVGEIPKALAFKGPGADSRITGLSRTDENTITLVFKGTTQLIPWTLAKVATPE